MEKDWGKKGLEVIAETIAIRCSRKIKLLETPVEETIGKMKRFLHNFKKVRSKLML